VVTWGAAGVLSCLRGCSGRDFCFDSILREGGRRLHRTEPRPDVGQGQTSGC
jgi:hypothetical protein